MILKEKVHVMAAPEDMMLIAPSDSANKCFWGQSSYKRKDVETVTFQNTLKAAPEKALDVSAAGDKSVLAWMEGGDLYVAANGKIAANPNASWMFAYFENLVKIDFGDCFDTSKVTDMCAMFEGCRSLSDLKCSDDRILAEYENR